MRPSSVMARLADKNTSLIPMQLPFLLRLRQADRAASANLLAGGVNWLLRALFRTQESKTAIDTGHRRIRK